MIPPKSDELLDTVILAAEEVARETRELIWSGDYYERGESRRYRGADDLCVGFTKGDLNQCRLAPQFRWSLDICRVAAGDLDATVEVAKGFRIWDLIAAAHMLENAGGCFRLSDGGRIRVPLDCRRRFRFIAAPSEVLWTELNEAIEWPD